MLSYTNGTFTTLRLKIEIRMPKIVEFHLLHRVLLVVILVGLVFLGVEENIRLPINRIDVFMWCPALGAYPYIRYVSDRLVREKGFPLTRQTLLNDWHD